MCAHRPRINRSAALAFLLIPFALFAQDKTSPAPSKPHAKTEKRTSVEINTTQGKVVVELYNETPQHRDNFIKLVKEHYYDSLLFHRVIPSFMIQGGDPNSRNAAPGVILGEGGPDYTIPAEFNKAFIHKKGALSAARQSDQVNPQQRSSGSQFLKFQLPNKAELDSVRVDGSAVNSQVVSERPGNAGLPSAAGRGGAAALSVTIRRDPSIFTPGTGATLPVGCCTRASILPPLSVTSSQLG